ncbi:MULTISPECIES: Wzz/FepE/Etk N-terminal domain-containing protein [unclassified Fusibacter]|uniref:Wzz/FepE/Etk N-terminal domain-containing protein n=1 Tax=unclassified Fusibacter TaxID=2624464 RepID=UPI0010109C9D|nr:MULTISPECIES: Wzz/FepE/Etk N-terminal domain-containing protein [unclassified Fusibacter]MCK8061267.1 Wzz/FepE/Etk N-terminal domain-containing protein [Fusibacter sp. A2]NPE23389.1 hypothetical protein [Fusibacter sp. A1]RXV59172.1 hypothetical protein DWB64_16345 [Fusibacter sp. A1]
MEQQEYDEISLKELIMALWKERRIVIGFTITMFLLAAIYSYFIASPSYETKSVLMIKAPTEEGTRYGTYQFPSRNASDYLQYFYNNDLLEKVIKENELETTPESFKNSIVLEQEEESNRFSVVVTNEDPAMGQKINQDLINRFIIDQRILYKKNAINSFILNYEISIDNLKNSIDTQESLAKSTKELLDTLEPIYTLQKSLFNDPEAAAAYAKNNNLDLSTLYQNLMTEEYSNGNYLKIETQHLDIQTTLISLRESLDNKLEFYDELIAERELLAISVGTENEQSILNNRLDVFNDKIFVISEAYLPEKPVGPRKALNMAIGLVLGVMLGVFAGLFKNYWKTT